VSKLVLPVRGDLEAVVQRCAGLRHELHRPVDDGAPVSAVVCVWDAPPARFDDLPVDGYLVDERVQWEEAAPGIERIAFVRRLPALSHEDFADHWMFDHAPLARRHHPGICRYVQNVVIGTIDGATPGVDGIAELGFASRADLEQRMYDSPRGREVIAADVARFIDIAAGWRVLTRPANG